jgi:hypothetical protein
MKLYRDVVDGEYAKFKKLSAVYKLLFGEEMTVTHNALVDVENCKAVYLKLIEVANANKNIEYK